MTKKFNEDDYCDIYANRICDNCGDCLEMEGIDTKAINIEEISKSIEENKFLEEELKKLYENALSESKDEVVEEFQLDESIEEDLDYIDAFENIEYLEDIDLSDEDSLEDLTEELFPGVRRLKKK